MAAPTPPSDSWFRADRMMFDHMDQSEYHYFHTAGRLRRRASAGPTKLAFSKGFEYLPAEREVEIHPDRAATLTVSLERPDNLPAKAIQEYRMAPEGRSYIIGSNRVYVNTGKRLDYDEWIADFRAGHAFVSSGPLVFFTLEGKGPGEDIGLAAGRHQLHAAVEVESGGAIQQSCDRCGEAIRPTAALSL